MLKGKIIFNGENNYRTHPDLQNVSLNNKASDDGVRKLVDTIIDKAIFVKDRIIHKQR